MRRETKHDMLHVRAGSLVSARHNSTEKSEHKTLVEEQKGDNRIPYRSQLIFGRDGGFNAVGSLRNMGSSVISGFGSDAARTGGQVS